jgi:hypothetical protein
MALSLWHIMKCNSNENLGCLLLYSDHYRGPLGTVQGEEWVARLGVSLL